MYKGAHDKQSFTQRTASHATKPYASGRVDGIPPWAAEPEEYYRSIRGQWQALNDQLRDCQDKLAAIRQRLKTTLPRKEYDHLIGQREHLANRASVLQEQATSYRSLARQAGLHSWSATFYFVACKMLSKEQLYQIADEAQAILGRHVNEIPKGHGEYTPEKREAVKRQKRQQERRASFHKHHPGPDRVVWKDNAPVAQVYRDEIRRR